MTKEQLQLQFNSLENLHLQNTKRNVFLEKENKTISEINRLNDSIIATYKKMQVLSESTEDSYKKIIEYDSEVIKHRNLEIDDLTKLNKNMFITVIILFSLLIINSLINLIF